jgi:hypothetical protein
VLELGNKSILSPVWNQWNGENQRQLRPGIPGDGPGRRPTYVHDQNQR